MAELKTCPFCGGYIILSERNDTVYAISVEF